jgi:hypothetical protein
MGGKLAYSLLRMENKKTRRLFFDQTLRNRLKYSIFELPFLCGVEHLCLTRQRNVLHVSMRLNTSTYATYVSIRQHTSSYVSICVDDVTDDAERLRCSTLSQHCVTVSTVSCLDTVSCL